MLTPLVESRRGPCRGSDTVLSVDRRRHVTGLAELAGVPVEEFVAAAQGWGPAHRRRSRHAGYR